MRTRALQIQDICIAAKSLLSTKHTTLAPALRASASAGEKNPNPDNPEKKNL